MVARMADGGRAKLNELVILQHKPGASTAGGFVGHGATHLSSVLGHLLTQHGGVPAAKVTIVGSTATIGDLPIAPATLARALDQLEHSGRVRVLCDRYNAVVITPAPASPAYTATSAACTFDHGNVVGDVEVGWSRAHAVAQVRVTAREAASLRTYDTRYPARPASLGEIVQVRYALVRSGREAVDAGEAEFRAGNARRQYRFATGFAPWLAWGDRVIVNFDRLDASGQHLGGELLRGRYSAPHRAG